MAKKHNLFILAIFFVVGVVNLTTFTEQIVAFKTSFVFACIAWLILFVLDKSLVGEFV